MIQDQRQFRRASRRIELHELGCQCEHCETHAPSVPDRLTAADLGKLAAAGALVGTVIAFAWDAHAALAALAATLGVAL